MRFGAHHEWGKLREVVIGISPAEDFVVFHEESDPIERQVDALAELVAREGVAVHRPHRLAGQKRTFLAPNRACPWARRAALTGRSWKAAILC